MYQLPIVERKIVAKDTVEVVFDIRGRTCDFHPGQYISITLPDLIIQDEKGSHRDFSIASSPNNKKTLSIAFRISQSGFKQTLMHAPIGTKVDTECCYGAFTLSDESSRPLVFIAGGIGITPFLSFIRFAAEEKLPHTILLIYGNHDIETAAYLSELESLEKENPNFSMKKQFGPITKKLIEETVGTKVDPMWHIVGSPAMVRGVKSILSEMGVSRESIRFEEFPGYGKRAEDADNREGASAVAKRAIASEEGEAMLQALNKTAIVSETDLDGIITYVNDKFCEISKYGREELIGQNHRIIKSGSHPAAFYEELWKTISSGRVWRGEIRNKAKDGSYYWVESSIAPIFGKDGKITKYIAARFPITEKKKIEENLNAQIQEYEKMNALMIGRELKMVELKKRIAELEKGRT